VSQFDLVILGGGSGGYACALRSAQLGLFLKEFVNDELPWLHLDIAGPAFNEGKAHGYTPVGGTGVSMRSLVRLVEQA